MASFTMYDTNRFPPGQSVAVYPLTNWPTGVVDQNAAPIGSATDTQTMGTNNLTFVGLTEGVQYVAYASVNGQHRYTSVRIKSATDAPVAAEPTIQSGTLANRPAAAPGNATVIYFATDDNGGTLYRSDGSTWTKVAPGVTQASGTLLAMGQATSPTPITSTTTTPGADLSANGLTITVTGGVPMVLYATALSFYNSTASKGTRVGIFEGATRIAGNNQGNAMAANTHQTCFIAIPLTPSAGSHTYHIKLATDSAGTANLNVTTDSPGAIWAVAA